MQLQIHHYAEIGSFLGSLLFYKRLKGSLFMWFIPFLGITVCAEIGATYMKQDLKQSNVMLYNFFTTFEFLFYFWFMSFFMDNKRLRLILKILIPLYLLAVFLNLAFFETGKFHSKTYLAGGILIVFFCLLYFFKIIRNNDINFEIEKEPFFWVVLGLLLFYLGGIAINTLLDYLGPEKRLFYLMINRWLNVLLYGSFIVAFFLCKNRIAKY